VELCYDTSSKETFISKHDIKDRSKTDAFSKVFAIVQSSWLIVQSITRVASGLSLSQLEPATMAYIIPAAVMYGFWLEKPFDVEHVTTIHRPRDKMSTDPVPWKKNKLVQRNGKCGKSRKGILEREYYILHGCHSLLRLPSRSLELGIYMSSREATLENIWGVCHGYLPLPCYRYGSGTKVGRFSTGDGQVRYPILGLR